MENKIDALFALCWLKKKVDAAYKNAETEAAIYLDEAREEGKTALVSTYFGEEAGEYKRGKTRKKRVTEYHVLDMRDLLEWLTGNIDAARSYACNNAIAFAQYWFDNTGEVPDGISRVEYDDLPKLKKPEIYRYNQEAIESKVLSEGLPRVLAQTVGGDNVLLLGDGDE